MKVGNVIQIWMFPRLWVFVFGDNDHVNGVTSCLVNVGAADLVG